MFRHFVIYTGRMQIAEIALLITPTAYVQKLPSLLVST